MHIGFITPEYPHQFATPSGGLGTSIKNLASSLVFRQKKVTVFVYGQTKDLEFQENGIHFYFIAQKKFRFMGWFRYRKYLQDILNVRIQKEKINIIEAPDWTGISAFMKLSCPLIIRMNGSDGYFCHLDGRKQKLKNRFFEGKALKSADGLISVSQFTALKTKKIFNLKRSITVIPNAVEVNKFLPSDDRSVANRLLYFGTVIRKKGVLELAQIFNDVIKKRPETELLIIGKDVVDIFQNKSTIKLFKDQLIPQAKQQFRYRANMDYFGIQIQLKEAAVVVLPSFAEALPMTWLEAMAMEKALVTSNIGWANEVMINEVTGYTEDPRNHESYAGKILTFLENSELAKRMGRAARNQVVQKFSTDIVVEQNINFYKKFL